MPKYCMPGWSYHEIGNTKKCFFTAKIEVSQVENFCQTFNAVVPYPKTSEENQNYRDAFNSMNISTSIAIKSCHGVIELRANGDWNPFPTNKKINVACEKGIKSKTGLYLKANPGTRNLLYIPVNSKFTQFLNSPSFFQCLSSNSKRSNL